MERKNFFSSRVPAPRGCYSQAIILGNLLFSAGQLPVDPHTGEFVRGGVSAQALQIMKNIDALLNDAGSSLQDIVKTTIFLRRASMWDEVNDVYSSFFQNLAPPARTVLSGIDIHYGLDVEMEVIAHIPEGMMDLI